MKKILLIIPILLISIIVFSQSAEDQWINRTKFFPTENCIDSVTCYTGVKVILNLPMIPDSAEVDIKLGTSHGLGDIYSRTVQKTSAIFSLPGVVQDSVGNAEIILGEYIIDENFFVNISLE